MELKVYKDKNEVAAQFSSFLVERIKNSERLTVALSGGSTPKVVFDYLAEHHNDLDWSKLHLYWGDERCVPPTDDESNYKMTVDHLLSKIEIPESNIHRVRGEDNPEQEATRYAETLEATLDGIEIPQFDLVILGMGSDGHTASIFPHEIDLWNAESHCVVATHPDSGQKRVSLNGKVINNAQEVAFLVTGSDKLEKVTEIMEGAANAKTYPASLVVPISGKLYWFLDEATYQG